MQTQQQIGKPEKFDLKTFNEHKDEYGQCDFETKNGLYIEQSVDNYLKEYYEFVTNRTSSTDCYYTLYKVFYQQNCMIKERGTLYGYNHSNLHIGTWEYFDSTGKLIKTVNHDKDYKVSYAKALSIAEYRYGFKQKDVSIEMLGDRWFIQAVDGEYLGYAAFVNTKNGKSELTRLVQNTHDEHFPTEEEEKADSLWREQRKQRLKEKQAQQQKSNDSGTSSLQQQLNWTQRVEQIRKEPYRENIVVSEQAVPRRKWWRIWD